jgi:cytochrome c oxidase cbb3-type subunit 3
MLGWTAALAIVAALRPEAGAQAPAPQQGPAGPRFPAQLRAREDPEAVERGRRIYSVSCRSCHGPDLRGGDMGGPNLLRSSIMLNDQKGELLAPILATGRGAMPAVSLPAADVAAVAAYIHSVLASGRAQGAPPAGDPIALDILVGDAAAGQRYFATHCGRCHSPTGDLQGIASRVADPVDLQNLWVGGGRDRAGLTVPDPPTARDALVTVSPASGPPVTGRLQRLDDFIVTLALADGTQRSFRRVGDTPRVEVDDPLAAHRAMLQQYTDREIHDMTAYLVTLR